MRKTLKPQNNSLNMMFRKSMYSNKNTEEEEENQIDNEFKEIIEKQCPGKLYRVLRKRMKKRIVT